MPDSASFVMPTDGADTREIPLSRGLVAIVDAADYDAVMAAGPWYAHSAGRKMYAARTVRLDDGRRTALLMHTFLTGTLGVDHVGGDGLDNRRSNLRRATQRQNSRNRQLGRNNTSGYKGVSWHKRQGVWLGRIKVDGRQIHLGCFPTAEQAAEAYNAAAIEHFGDFAWLNTIPAEVAA